MTTGPNGSDPTLDTSGAAPTNGSGILNGAAPAFSSDSAAADASAAGRLQIDTLLNLVTGMGTNRDPGMFNQHILDERISLHEADALYLNDWLGAAVIDTIPDDAVRQWREISGLEGDKLEKYQRAEKAYQVSQTVNQAMKWARLYGGAGIIMGIDGAGEFHEPLDIDRVRPDSLKWLSLVDRWHLIPQAINLSNPLRANWGRPEIYTAYGGNDPVHRSRILFFYGTPLPYHLARRSYFWGASILERVKVAIENADVAQSGIAALITDAKVDVFKIPGLFDKLRTPQGNAQVMDRLQLSNLGKSIFNGIVIDAAEDYEQKTGALSPGLSGLLSQFLQVVAAASGIPVTRLLGTSTPGMNATGEEDTRKYYDRVTAIQADTIEPVLEVLDSVMLRSVFGEEPDEFKSEFKSLWQQSDTERATTQLQDAQRDQAYLDAGIVKEHHIADRLIAENIYPTLETKDSKALAATEADYGEEPEIPDPAEGGGFGGFGGSLPTGE